MIYFFFPVLMAVRTRSSVHQTFSSLGTKGSVPGVKPLYVNLTTFLNLVPRLRMSGALPPPVCHCGVHGNDFTLYLYLHAIHFSPTGV